MKTKIYLIIALVSLSGCSAIMVSMYGINSPKKLDDKTIAKYAKKYDIPAKDSYKTDSSYYSYIFSFDTTLYKQEIKNHYQPLQALYFDNQGELESFQINCYCGGFPNLDWERDSIFTEFPPKEQAPTDSLISLEKMLTLLEPFPDSDEINIDGYDYVVLVLWSRWMGRQSRRLIELVQENAKLAPNKNIKILYANNDNMFELDE